MTPTSHAGQDPAVAVLQAQQTALDTAVRELARNVAEGLSSINTKMDRLNDISTTIAQMSTRQEAHSDGLSRAFKEIGALQDTLDNSVVEIQRWREDFTRSVDERFSTRDQLRSSQAELHSKEHQDIDRRLTLAKGIFMGAGLAYGLLLGMVTWAASTYIGDTREHGERLHKLELTNAKHYPGEVP